MTGNEVARGAGSFPRSRSLGTSNVASPNMQKALGSITSTEQFESGSVLGKQRQGDQGLQVILSCTGSVRPAQARETLSMPK